MKKRMIDADALIKFMNERHKTLVDENGWYDHYTSGYEDAITDVEEAPIVDAAPVQHGHWIHDGPAFKGGVDWYRCSVCGCRDVVEWMKYCPNCGAKMDGGNEDAVD